MRRAFIVGLLIAVSIITGKIANAQMGELERAGDAYYANRNLFVHGKPDAGNIEKAIETYKKILAQEELNDRVMMKYMKAVDFNTTYFISDTDEKKEAYLALIKGFEEKYEECGNSKYLNHCLAITWGRYGELINLLTAARSGIAGKVKRYSERLYELDKTHNDYMSGLLLGRLHYKTPKIPLVLGWPNIKKSRQYLEEVVENCPDYLWGKLFLADTLCEMKETEKAKEYYNDLIQRTPRKYDFQEDSKVIRDARERLRELEK